MEERKDMNQQQDNQLRNTDLQDDAGQHNVSNNDQDNKGISPERLSEITRRPTERASGSGVTTKRFITGDNSDGQA